MLSNIDKKILSLLSINSRLPTRTIAKKLKLPISTVYYRINYLEKEKILTYRAVINHSKMGLQYCRLGVKLYDNQQKNIDEFIDYLKHRKDIQWIANVHGIYDVIFVFFANTFDSLTSLLSDIKINFSKNIELTYIGFLKKMYFGNPLISNDTIVVDYSKIEDITDELDKKIINALEQKPSQNILTLAAECNCTSKTALLHLRKLNKNKIILNNGVTLDYSKLGYNSAHIFWEFFVNDIKKIELFKSHLLDLPFTRYVVESLGGIAILESEFVVKNESEIFDIVSNLRKYFPDFIKGFQLLTYIGVKKEF
ncbi:MAG: Lrp/AsnC family transcriptional regulator [Candidatus Woesearchaeota archaeon]